MTIRIIRASAALSLILVALTPSANATEIRVWTARIGATILARAGAEFESATGHKLIITSDLANAFARRAGAGETFDALITASPAVDQWIRDGKVIARTRRDIASSGIGVAVRAGAPRPDISTPEAFKRTLLAAKSIAFLRLGSGLHMTELLEQFGIAKTVATRITRPETDSVCELVADGEVELGIVVTTQILTSPGVELVGPLPSEVQSYVVFSGGVSATSKVPDAALQLLEFLAGPTAIAVMKSQGMQPGATAAIVDQLTAQADRWDKAIVRKDRAAIEANMADDFRQIDGRGNVETRASFVDGLVSPDLKIDPYTVEDFEVRVYGDAALLSGRTRMTGKYQGTPFASHYRFIDAYARRNGEWKIVSVQITPIPGS